MQKMSDNTNSQSVNVRVKCEFSYVYVTSISEVLQNNITQIHNVLN